MRVIVTGQVGLHKQAFLEAAALEARAMGETLHLHHLGELMYAEAPDVTPGRILNLPLSRLNSLRRAAFRRIMAEAQGQRHAVVNTHATFRWRHGLFAGFDFDQLREFGAQQYVCLVDNIETVHHRLHAEHEIDASLKDCMVWREEEILATELMAQATGGRFYILSRGRSRLRARTLARLICQPDIRKVYPSFPMTHVAGLPAVRKEIDAFRDELDRRFITFDPGDVDEKHLLERAIEAARRGEDFIEFDPPPDASEEERAAVRRVSVRETLEIAGDIDGQIYMRDFKLIDQSDMIVSLIPELPDGSPALSSGVERELQHAFEHTKEVYVVWRPRRGPSPFITETATRIFRTVHEALEHFEEKGMTAADGLFEER
ncbi:MAG: hypothetical protein D6824_02015 [Planctomycetota bacterium]|nr:MAG: hypothetical protein D6824_02015 [Planctomycetota bacterium]